MTIDKNNVTNYIKYSKLFEAYILEISCLRIHEIKYIPNNITRIYCRGNILTYLPNLPEGLEYLDCFNNKLTTLPELPKSLQELYCHNNKLTTLPELPESLEDLTCWNNPNLPYAGIYRGKEEIKELRNRINMDLYLEGKI